MEVEAGMLCQMEVEEWRRPTGLQTQIESGSNNWPGEGLALPDRLPRTLIAIVRIVLNSADLGCACLTVCPGL